MKPALFIDYHGTLCDDLFWKNLDPDSMKQVQTYMFKDNPEIISKWMKGEFTSEEINKKVADDLGIPFDVLWKGFVSGCEENVIDPKSLELIKELQKKYTAILITDNMDCFDRFTVPALKLKDYFNFIVNSYDEKMLKKENEGETFKIVADRLGISISNSILIDNYPKACGFFEKLGGKSLLVAKDNSLHDWLIELSSK
jgi:FMN phosphatase YigB (HAD superfamily)